MVNIYFVILGEKEIYVFYVIVVNVTTLIVIKTDK
jgi:hypothetical protein